MDCRRYWASKCQGRQVLVVDFQVFSNSLQSWSKAVPGGVTDGQFSGLLHFVTDRTLSGWTLLFAMGKHTSKEFLYDREHVRVWKCRKTRSKSGTKSGLKRGPSQHPKSKKHRYTGKSSLQRGQKKYSKTSPKTTPK
jgi:hypothetical protein